jgi:hypothetical protein
VMPLMESEPVPVLVSLIVWAELVVPTVWLAKVKLVGERLTAGVNTTPVPLSVTACGLAGALSLTEIAPVRVPDAVGAKRTEMLQLALAARLEPQLLVCEKSPVAAMLLMESEPDPVLVSVTV